MRSQLLLYGLVNNQQNWTDQELEEGQRIEDYQQSQEVTMKDVITSLIIKKKNLQYKW